MFSHIFLNNVSYDIQAYKTLIGGILIKFATGLIGTIGNTNLYFLSQLLQQGQQINNNTFSIIMLTSLIPVCLITLIATKLSNHIGYQKIIKICAVIFLISPFFYNIKHSINTFSIFCIFLPASAFSISGIPLLNILWSQFPENRHKITSIIVFSWTMSSIIWNYVFLLGVNPNNIKANVEHLGQFYFQEQVTTNLISTFDLIVFICGICFITGSFLIKQKKNVANLHVQLQLQQILSNQPIPPLSIKQFEKTNIITLICHKNFICIYSCSLISSLYFTYVVTNNKLIFIQLINDDHFLTYSSIAYAIAGLFGTFIWGHVGDLNGIRKAMFIYTVLDIIFKLTIFVVDSKITFILYSIALGILDKAAVTMIGPGLVELFGLENGTQLLPIKATSVIFTYMIIPIAQILTTHTYTPLRFLEILGLINIITIVPSFFLMKGQY